MLGDENPTIGNGSGGPVDPSLPLFLIVQQLETATSASIEDPQELIDNLVDDVLELPPEERFERAIVIVEDHLEDEFGSVGVFESKLPLAPAIAFELFQRFIDEWSNEIAESALQQKRKQKNGLLVLLAAVDVLRDAVELLKEVKEATEKEQEDHPIDVEDLSDQEIAQLGSAIFSIYARLYQEVQADQRGDIPDFAALATDILYGERTVVQIVYPEIEYPAIKEMQEWQRLRGSQNRGAVRAYDLLDISIARGAELAELSQNEFRELLESRGLRPEYGPDTIDEFYSGPDLMNE